MCLALEKDTSTNFALCFSVSGVFSCFGVSTVCLLGLQFICKFLVPLTGIAATAYICQSPSPNSSAIIIIISSFH